jgi:glycosyltransferase involved in cell wall biosynthesis
MHFKKMKIAFFSNYLNHLQSPFCDEMYNYLGSDFKFISTEILPIERLSSGYEDCSNYPYNINSFDNETNYCEALRLGYESDIVITGSAPSIFIKERLRKNKLTFRYSERLLKRGAWILFDPRVLRSLLRDHTIYRSKNLYMLCSSAFTANDLSLIFAYPRKKYKWGYFTKVEELKIEHVISQKPLEGIEIIWTARFIDWKHPELAVKLASELKKRGYNFHLNMIGAGNMVEYIQELVGKLNVSDCVTLLGSMTNSDVRSYMQKSNIFIFTSDRNEGWGVVLNEAMSCGCAVVVSNTIGAVPYLIENEKNGLVFKSGCLASLLFHVERLLNNKILRENLGQNAYQTLTEVWNPKKAASNFLLLANSIYNNHPIRIESGPCSIATRTKKVPLGG